MYASFIGSHALKGQKLLAQGIALGIMAISNAPCKGKSFVIIWFFEAFALTGRQVCDRNNPGRCPGLGASALSGRVGQNLRNPEIRKSARRSGDTQVAQSAYSSGSIRLLKWLNQLTQVAQPAYSSGSIRLLKWLNQRVQPSA